MGTISQHSLSCKVKLKHPMIAFHVKPTSITYEAVLPLFTMLRTLRTLVRRAFHLKDWQIGASYESQVMLRSSKDLSFLSILM